MISAVNLIIKSKLAINNWWLPVNWISEYKYHIHHYCQLIDTSTPNLQYTLNSKKKNIDS